MAAHSHRCLHACRANEYKQYSLPFCQVRCFSANKREVLSDTSYGRFTQAALAPSQSCLGRRRWHGLIEVALRISRNMPGENRSGSANAALRIPNRPRSDCGPGVYTAMQAARWTRRWGSVGPGRAGTLERFMATIRVNYSAIRKGPSCKAAGLRLSVQWWPAGRAFLFVRRGQSSSTLFRRFPKPVFGGLPVSVPNMGPEGRRSTGVRVKRWKCKGLPERATLAVFTTWEHHLGKQRRKSGRPFP